MQWFAVENNSGGKNIPAWRRTYGIDPELKEIFIPAAMGDESPEHLIKIRDKPRPSGRGRIATSASADNICTKNDFDYTACHGNNIRAAGHSVLACGEKVLSGLSTKQEPAEGVQAVA